MMPRGWTIVIIIVAVVILFGWRRLPDMARSVGQSLRVFKSEVTDNNSNGQNRDASSQHQAGPGALPGEQPQGGAPQQPYPGQPHQANVPPQQPWPDQTHPQASSPRPADPPQDGEPRA